MKDVGGYLKTYTVSDLKRIAKTIGVTGFSKLKKDELIEAVISTQQLTKTAEYAYKYIDSQSFQSLKEVSESGTNVLSKPFPLENIFGLYIMGYAFEDEKHEGDFYIMPLIQKLFRIVNTEENYEARIEVQRHLNLIRAALHLYGIVSFDQVIHLFKKYYDEVVTAEEIVQFLEDSPYETTVDLDKNEIIIDDMNEEQYSMVKKLQGSRPYYEPEFAKFIKFSNPNYIDESNAHKRLRTFIETRMSNHKQDTQPVYIELLEHVMRGKSRKQINEFLTSYGIYFDAPKEESEFFSNVDGIIQNTRHFKYRGFKESEIAVKTVVKEEKVGRNDPCPCGSGRKYKKCCGR